MRPKNQQAAKVRLRGPTTSAGSHPGPVPQATLPCLHPVLCLCKVSAGEGRLPGRNISAAGGLSQGHHNRGT